MPWGAGTSGCPATLPWDAGAGSLLPLAEPQSTGPTHSGGHSPTAGWDRGASCSRGSSACGDEKIQAGGNAADAACSSPKLATACKPCRAGNAGRRSHGGRCGSPTHGRRGGHLTPRLHLGKGTVHPDTHRRLGRPPRRCRLLVGHVSARGAPGGPLGCIRVIPPENYPSLKGRVHAEGWSRTGGAAIAAWRQLEPVSGVRHGPCSSEGEAPAPSGLFGALQPLAPLSPSKATSFFPAGDF